VEERDYVADARFDLDAAIERVNRAEGELCLANDAHTEAFHALDAANAKADDEHQAWREQVDKEIAAQNDQRCG
jgi:hypothetical protein